MPPHLQVKAKLQGCQTIHVFENLLTCSCGQTCSIPAGLSLRHTHRIKSSADSVMWTGLNISNVGGGTQWYTVSGNTTQNTTITTTPSYYSPQSSVSSIAYPPYWAYADEALTIGTPEYYACYLLLHFHDLLPEDVEEVTDAE